MSKSRRSYVTGLSVCGTESSALLRIHAGMDALYFDGHTMQPITRRDWDHTISERRKGGIVKTAGVVVQARWTERRGDGFKR